MMRWRLAILLAALAASAGVGIISVRHADGLDYANTTWPFSFRTGWSAEHMRNELERTGSATLEHLSPGSYTVVLESGELTESAKAEVTDGGLAAVTLSL